MSPRPRRIREPNAEEEAAIREAFPTTPNTSNGTESLGSWQCTICKRVIEGAPGDATKDPKFRIGQCPECQYKDSIFLRVK